MKTYDLIVIGAGSGGLVSAEFAAKLGAKVLLIEKNARLGGECLHTGCVPSKALIHGAEAGFTFAKALAHAAKSIDIIEERSDNDAHVESFGAEVIHGAASFIDSRTVVVNNVEYRAKKFIIATGSTPRMPEMFAAIDKKRLKTNDNFFKKRARPKKLVIVGAGPVGLEMAYAMQKLGTSVIVIDTNETVMPFMSPEISKEFEAQFIERTKAKLLLGHSIVDAQSNYLIVESLGKRTKITFDELLIAAGRVPNFPDGLLAAKVAHTDKGIAVNSAMRSSNRRIYAVGDVALAQKFTHTAAESAAIALTHSLFGIKGRKNVIASTPFATFAKPVVAGVGIVGAGAQHVKGWVETVSFDMNNNDRAITDQAPGRILVHVGKRGKILGAEIIAANADELIGYFAYAMSNKLPLQSFGKTIFTYPTQSLAIKQLSAAYAIRPLSKYQSTLDLARRFRL